MKEAEHFIHPPFKLAGVGFSFTMPRGWEVVSFLHEDLQGRFVFSSERGAHGQFSWRRVKAVPDIPRIIEEIHRREIGAEAPPKIRFTHHGQDGNVILGHTHPGERFYASVFNPELQQLNEWIFPRYSPAAAEEVIPMLQSYTHNPADAGHRIFYACFGLELSVPETFTLQSLEAYPAAITLNFENKKHHRLIAHRWGMAELVKQGANTSNFYHRFLYKKRYKIKNAESQSISSHDGSHITFITRGRFDLDYLLGAWWRGEGEAFLVSSENRIYGAEHIAPNKIKDRETAKMLFKQKLSERQS